MFMTDETLLDWYRTTIDELSATPVTVVTASGAGALRQHFLIEPNRQGTETVLRLAAALEADAVVLAVYAIDSPAIRVTILGKHQVVIDCIQLSSEEVQLPDDALPTGTARSWSQYTGDGDPEFQALERQVDAMDPREATRLSTIMVNAARTRALDRQENGDLWEPPRDHTRMFDELRP